MSCVRARGGMLGGNASQTSCCSFSLSPFAPRAFPFPFVDHSGSILAPCRSSIFAPFRCHFCSFQFHFRFIYVPRARAPAPGPLHKWNRNGAERNRNGTEMEREWNISFKKYVPMSHHLAFFHSYQIKIGVKKAKCEVVGGQAHSQPCKWWTLLSNPLATGI